MLVKNYEPVLPMKKLLPICFIALLSACNNAANKNEPLAGKYKTTGSVKRLDSALNLIISSGAQAEIIAEGLERSEGSVPVFKFQDYA